jgi:L-amino acid N-acyltransferase YncA
VLVIVPCTLRAARIFVAQHHRHHKPPQGGLFAVAAAVDGEIVGVAIVGMPVARMAADGYTAEVTRLCTTGEKNACSTLYSACWRAARALGYRRLITYILASEPGTSLRAAGWRCLGECGGGSWSRRDRPRVDEHPTQKKLRFEVG